ncbi:MAG: YqgE/AlgH family protein [Proteobacteria bacterium]|nr:YqgE/AlgH family protein [Pseudomonadota bacterium]
MSEAFRIRSFLAAAGLAVLLLLPSPLAAAGAAPPPAVPNARAAARALTAILLVARGAVADPNFGGSIVVVMNNLAPAPVGIIINRPMPISVVRLFPQLQRLAHVHARVYYGGPVEFGKAWYLFRAKTAPAGAVRVCDGVYVGAGRKLLLELLARKNPMQGLRIFVGHAGWTPGQLQAEVEGGAWAARRADADSIFHPKPLRPWPSPRSGKPGT